MLRPKLNTGGVAPALKSAALITSDEKNIYLCCTSAGAGIKDGPAWTQDSVVFLVAPPAADAIYRFTVSSDGSVAATMTRGGNETAVDAKNLGIASAVMSSETMWNIEMNIPAAAFGPETGLANETWRVNIVRQNTHDKGETSFWSGEPQNFSTLAGLGDITFLR